MNDWYGDDYSDTVAEDAELEDAYWREQDQEAEYEARQRAKQAEFDAALDEYQEREAELAYERERVGNVEAQRPDARRVQVTFADLRVDDYMTAEDGPAARWVKVVKIEPRGDKLAITFQTAQPIGVGMHDRWVIDRDPAETVVVDGENRA